MVRWLRGDGEALRAAAAAPALWQRLSAASYHRTIQAVPRETAGPRAAARERAANRVPAVVINHDATPFSGSGAANRQLLTADAKQIRELLKESPFFLTTPIRLQVRAGVRSAAVVSSGTVLPIKVHREKETGKILNLVMAWANEGTELKVDVPVVFKGEDVCPGLKKGGYLQKIRASLKYLCPAEHIPPKVEVDLTNLDVGDRVSMHDIAVHPSLKLLSKNDAMPVCKILASKPVEAESKQISKAQDSQDDTAAKPFYP